MLTPPPGAKDDVAFLMANQPLTVPCGEGAGSQEQLVQITAMVSSSRLPAVLLAVDPSATALARQQALPAFGYGQIPSAQADWVKSQTTTKPRPPVMWLAAVCSLQINLSESTA